MNNDTTSGGRSLPARRFAGYALVAAAVSLALTGCQDSGSGVRESAGDGAAAGAPDSGQGSSPGRRTTGRDACCGWATPSARPRRRPSARP
ncbi:hypothetical protein [Streptomyces olivaceus]|uniref:hypothetical protein n=1 Tax=Streptomyces olivaceus TaxID=47716 RepID=UPI001D17179F|nr:hypothetical protein [Streptomyces olivaceus]